METDLPPLLEVGLVPDQHHHHVVPPLVADVFDPLACVQEAASNATDANSKRRQGTARTHMTNSTPDSRFGQEDGSKERSRGGSRLRLAQPGRCSLRTAVLRLLSTQAS